MTARAAGVHPSGRFMDVLLRPATCTDLTKLTPHRRKENFAAEVSDRLHALQQQVLVAA